MIAVRKLRSGPGNVDLHEADEGKPAADEVVLKVHGAGICGTDLHIQSGDYPSNPPVTLGHEVSGQVVDVGPGVDEDWLGIDVVTETFFSTCGLCRYCRAGRPNLCPRRRSIGSHVDGGMARTVVVPAGGLHRIPQGVDPRAASITEPLAAVANALCDPSVIDPGDQAVIVGPGPIGLLAAQVARAAGASVLVVGTEFDQVRLDAARSLGFESVSTADLEPTAGPFDMIIDCAGAEAAAVLAFGLVRKGGRIVRIGVAGRDVTVPLDELCYRELTLTSGFATTPTSWRRALGLLTAGDVQLEPLITEYASLGDWQRVFDACRTSSGVKYVFDPEL